MKKILSMLLVLLLVIGMAAAEEISFDRAGNPISLPENKDKLISLAPSVTQVIEALGLTDRLIAVDTYSSQYTSLPEELPQFDMMNPDIERLAALQPDIIFTSGMAYIEDNPYAQLTELGICVIEIPSSESIEGIGQDIRFIAEVLDVPEGGEAIVAEMQGELEKVAALGEGITEKKRVFFEVGALHYIYSFGSGTFLVEMLTLVGAENVLSDQQSWLSVSEETAVALNPDVILTNVDYIEDPVAEILSRPGWENVTAVKNRAVYAIDNATSSIPNQNIIQALWEMGRKIYPEVFGE